MSPTGRRSKGVDSVSEWRYIPVRRFAVFIEKSVDRGTQWLVFEPKAPGAVAKLHLALRTVSDRAEPLLTLKNGVVAHIRGFATGLKH